MVNEAGSLGIMVVRWHESIPHTMDPRVSPNFCVEKGSCFVAPDSLELTMESWLILRLIAILLFYGSKSLHQKFKPSGALSPISRTMGNNVCCLNLHVHGVLFVVVNSCLWGCDRNHPNNSGSDPEWGSVDEGRLAIQPHKEKTETSDHNGKAIS